ncbi:putative ammonium transporter 2 [Glandiceps talaboti]
MVEVGNVTESVSMTVPINENNSFHNNESNSSEILERGWDDATWILTSAFIIFTMQSGFGLLESGSVSRKNEVNIMVKNAVDVIFGGLSYWMFGYGLSFGDDTGSNPFIGVGHFFVHDDDEDTFGSVYSSFFFHASFATTSTTIVSGAMAERTKLESYTLFSFINTFLYSIPTRWVWAPTGWLRHLGVVDIAGASCVHLVGGVTGLVATVMLKPRTGRFGETSLRNQITAMGVPTNAIFGMFMLWWGWLGFNCGSTYGITGSKWKLAARSAVTTVTCSVGGGIAGTGLSYIFKKRTFSIVYLINGILGSLVSGTALCALAHPWEGLLIGAVGGLISCTGTELMTKLKIDDPVGVVPVHGFAAIWGLIAVGLFVRKDKLGVFYGGEFYMLGVQTLAVVVVILWTLVTSFIILKLLDITVGLRINIQEEMLGSDIVEHALNATYDKKSGELRNLEGEIIEIVQQNGDDLYNHGLRRLSGAVAMRIPREILHSAANLGHSSFQPDCQEHQSVTSLGKYNHRLSVMTVSSLRRVSPIDDLSSVISLGETVKRISDGNIEFEQFSRNKLSGEEDGHISTLFNVPTHYKK